MTAPRELHFLLGDETSLYADAAYSSRATGDKLDDDQVQRKGYRRHPLVDADIIRNDAIAVTRSGGRASICHL